MAKVKVRRFKGAYAEIQKEPYIKTARTSMGIKGKSKDKTISRRGKTTVVYKRGISVKKG